MSYIVSWDGPSPQEPDRGREVTVETSVDLQTVLDEIAAQAATDEIPYAVQVHQIGRHGAIMIGVGHPERSFIDWLDRSQPHGTGNRYGLQLDLAPIDEPIGFDVYGNWTEVPPPRTRITPATARAAAGQYLLTAQRPTSVEWTTG